MVTALLARNTIRPSSAGNRTAAIEAAEVVPPADSCLVGATGIAFLAYSGNVLTAHDPA